MNKINRLIIDLSTLKKNINILKDLAKPARLYGVVKADAYGMGALEISKNIEGLIDGFCVSNIYEGLELRKSGIGKEILVLGLLQEEEYKLALEYNISVTIYSYELAKIINRTIPSPINVHLKVDTGHGRLGFLVDDEGIREARKIFALENIRVKGVFSHLATADEEDPTYTILQKESFDTFKRGLKGLGEGLDYHLANDAGLIKHGIKYDIIRSGICIHGIYPSAYIKENYPIGLEPIFTWLSKISHIKFINKGDSISYGRTFIADGRMKIATVSIGYADGYKRLISNRGYVLIKGKKARILGNITMDQMMVDVTDIDCHIYDDVVLIGGSGDEYIAVEDLASWAETIPYEIMTSISKRVERIFD